MSQLPLPEQYKVRLARQFSRAAIQYDTLAQVQADIAKDAVALLPAQCHRLLDIGCGTGRITRKLTPRSHHVIAMDLAFGMLQHARASSKEQVISWLQGDAEHLALADCSVDTVFSSMVLQWCKSPVQVMSEIRRVLSARGQAVLAVMCDGSFNELQQVWSQIDSQPHVNQFTSAAEWQQAARQSGMSVTLTTHYYQTWHRDIRALLASIKGIGANVLIKPQAEPHPAQPLPFKRGTLRTLQALYLQQSGEDRQLPLSYHIAFLHCIKSKG